MLEFSTNCKFSYQIYRPFKGRGVTTSNILTMSPVGIGIGGKTLKIIFDFKKSQFFLIYSFSGVKF